MPQPIQADFERLRTNLSDPAVRALFTERFVRLNELYDVLIDAAAWNILEKLGVLPAPGGLTVPEAAERCGAVAKSLSVLEYLLQKLAAEGWLSLFGERFHSTGDVPPSLQSAGAAVVSYEPAAAIGVEIVTLLAEESGAFFHGEKTGEDILFAVNRLPLWFRYFSNGNPLYGVNNALGAIVLGSHLPPSGAKVLEVGGGAGSAAEEALSRNGGPIGLYHFTELVPTFLRRGERAARASAGTQTEVVASRLDMTRPWGEQGIGSGQFDAVYAVNCFHVAPDLDRVLAEAFSALRPGGWLVLSECVKPGDPRRAIYVDFVFEFLSSFTNVKTDPERRPRHGFLSPQGWRASLLAAGFEKVEITPDVEKLAEEFPKFFVAALAARRPSA
ncbi:MAG: class I SAM-dependent methyltransferase [Acidobacteria bacterium]|nr:class I SAM-dependent methyltransferase [Acidobacteriota bacterium]MCG3193628.1 hypothetical protein [Thermoanaerobaculia bacterium]